MITFAYSAKQQNSKFERHLMVSSGLPSCEVIHSKDGHFAKVYNQVLKKAKNDIIMFVREDVELQSQDWGIKLIEQIEKSEFGIVGIIGSIIVPMSGLVWEKDEPLVGRIWYESYESKNEHRFSEAFPAQLIEVVTVDDALFIVDRRKLQSTFDTTYKGDSFYDLDFCLANYERGVKVGVTFDLKVVKKGFNGRDQDWISNQKLFVIKHKNLPFRLKPKIIVSSGVVKIERTPKVSIIICAKGKPVEFASCLESIYEKTKYPNYEVLVVDIGSEPDEVRSMIEYIKRHENTKFIEKQIEHVPTVMEEIIEKEIASDSELILFCDPEVILLNDAISRMVKAFLEAPESCGTIGIRMHNRNNMIRHFGLQLFSTQTKEGHELGLGYQGFQSAYRYKNKVVKNILGCTKDFMMIPRALFDKIGGFNKSYVFSLEDFELNISSILEGKKNIIVGSAVCYYLGNDIPQFLPDDFATLVNFINQHVDTITPFVELLYVT